MSNYWYETFGKRSTEFIAGVRAGVTAFATWNNGEQFVGVLKKPLQKVLKEIDEQLGWPIDKE